MRDDRQQNLLLTELNRKRELKRKYLYQPKETARPSNPDAIQRNALGELVMANIMLLAIRERKDIFGEIARLRAETRPPAFDGTLFGAMLTWCGQLAEALDCGAYEFFIDDKIKRRSIVCGLLENLKKDSFGCWEDISIDDSGSTSFALPHFDYYYRMTDQPKAEISLVFQREARSDGNRHYRLMIGDISRKKPDDLFPDHAVLWEEHSGFLKEFIDAAIADLEGGWMLLKEGFTRRREFLRHEAAKLRDLCDVLAEQPQGLNFKALLQKERQLLETLRAEERAAYDRMPAALKAGPRGENAKNCLLLLGGADKSLERAILSFSDSAQAPLTGALSESAYLLEHASDGM